MPRKLSGYWVCVVVHYDHALSAGIKCWYCSRLAGLKKKLTKGILLLYLLFPDLVFKKS